MSVQAVGFRPQTAIAEINITPLIDVMLALLLIFMLAAPIVAQRIALPIAPNTSKAPEPKTLELAISENGAYTLDGVELSRSLLDAQLRVEVAAHRDVMVKVRPAPHAPYSTVAAALASARNAGVDALGIESTHD